MRSRYLPIAWLAGDGWSPEWLLLLLNIAVYVRPAERNVEIGQSLIQGSLVQLKQNILAAMGATSLDLTVNLTSPFRQASEGGEKG
ncbi:unnamed protein product [Nippostrongylus brasiliensis]|uniref:Transcriptional regulator n=1 Tax=Nippostrongylus brasiliensis TaxID=27835 RepID=A0A0N4XHK0_NIPBR|nr:hypothetical protein Q1695_009595 [Nippostrongylus brasiliensis]VDL65592.1 unnamed protein product [Nippostrongylus brasiliensis]